MLDIFPVQADPSPFTTLGSKQAKREKSDLSALQYFKSAIRNENVRGKYKRKLGFFGHYIIDFNVDIWAPFPLAHSPHPVSIVLERLVRLSQKTGPSERQQLTPHSKTLET
jgi:hypothetical protein